MNKPSQAAVEAATNFCNRLCIGEALSACIASHQSAIDTATLALKEENKRLTRERDEAERKLRENVVIGPRGKYVHADFARDLERENHALRAELDALKMQIESGQR